MRLAFAAPALSLALALALAVPNPAQAYLAQNDLTIRPLSDGAFEVVAAPGLSAPAAWCAAGDYAIRVLQLGPATPIWRTSPPPRNRGQGVAFALTQGAAITTGLFLFGDADAAVTAGFAQSLCWKHDLD